MKNKMPKIVGVLNISPESANNKAITTEDIIERMRNMVNHGADVIDVGAQSSRPGVDQISLEEETSRLKGVVLKIKKEFPFVQISIDTTRHEIVQLALDEGVTIVNDISGGRFDEHILEKVTQCNAQYVLMHSQGLFSEMHKKYEYVDVVTEITNYFSQRIKVCLEAGIKNDNIILDPGIGFSKSGDQNLDIIRRLSEFKELGFPLYIGLSRKRFIGTIIGDASSDPSARDNATTVFHTLCIQQGVDYIRTHNVKTLKECTQVLESIQQS
ncbi:MAG: dihydropteroate synthase [Candidatus Pacebacteria bacterium]|nr:dihydropteroate synthase [Candidatus Paceibacterota bacterium]